MCFRLLLPPFVIIANLQLKFGEKTKKFFFYLAFRNSIEYGLIANSAQSPKTGIDIYSQ